MKVLITTDFSGNSRGGFRFAASSAKFKNAQLIFFHSFFIPKPAFWSESDYSLYANKESQKLLKRLNRFASSAFESMDVKPGNFKCVVEQSLIPESGISDYAKRHGIDFICISTRGAGKFKKFLGTTAGNLITQSPVPVIVVPSRYRAKSINRILYASDLKKYKEELKKVIVFAKPHNAPIELFHLTYPGEKQFDISVMAATLKRQFKYKIDLHMEKSDLTKPLVTNLQKAIAASKPSMVVMFTEQRRTFYQKIFLSSSSESIAFQSKVPMLVFNKTSK